VDQNVSDREGGNDEPSEVPVDLSGLNAKTVDGAVDGAIGRTHYSSASSCDLAHKMSQASSSLSSTSPCCLRLFQGLYFAM